MSLVAVTFDGVIGGSRECVKDNDHNLCGGDNRTFRNVQIFHANVALSLDYNQP